MFKLIDFGQFKRKIMIYTDLTKEAMKIAFNAHKEQVDKAGLPYVFHPLHLAEQMNDELSACAALLHDVVEDTEITFEELKSSGISDDVIVILRLLTHDDNVPFMDYVQKIKDSDNRIAKAVKLADLRHNSDLTRFSEVDTKTLDRLKKYKAAIELLEK